MGMQTVATAICQCTFGAAPTPLNVLPLSMVSAESKPAANIMDHKPFVNIVPFGVCTSLANPTVAAATAAALGVLTPMPCIPATVSPWIPTAPMVMIGGMPTLGNSSKTFCMWGGVISINMQGQFTVQV
tara:strand:+ start:15 stop:401 length:387 start_codon:yes stop_codon:yes gene_type:complete